MQLLGKQYFAEEEPMETVPTEEFMNHDEEGLEELCEAVAHPRVPAWMSAAAGMVRENKRHLAAAASVLVIGFAVYLNWAMSDTQGAILDGTVSQPQDYTDAALEGVEDLSSDVLSASDGGTNDDYFAVSQINRQRARDEAIAVLQDVVEGAVNLDDVQSDALAQITQIAADIENEAAIESLIKGKGFADCVAVISGENVNVIVRSSALLPNEIAQIQEIVYETAGILPANVKIIEK